MKTEKNVRILKKMVNYCEQIKWTKEFFQNDKQEFHRNRIFQDAASMCVLQIGELVGKLDRNIWERYPKIPWKQVKALRNVYAHAYGSVDWEKAWEVIDKDIPYLKYYCSKAIEELEKEAEKLEEKETALEKRIKPNKIKKQKKL